MKKRKSEIKLIFTEILLTLFIITKIIRKFVIQLNC